MKRLVAISALTLCTSAAFAQSDGKIPPENGKKVSEIIAQIEGRPDFRYLENVEWSRDGYYEITYHTADKAKVEIKIDAASGQPRD
jgi:hypothetical protein